MLDLEEPRIDVALVCSDFDASLDFYHRKLGLVIAEDLDISEETAVPSGLAPSGFRHVRLRAGNALIKLMKIEPTPPAPPAGFQAGVRWITFFVTDMTATIVELRSRGVSFTSEPIRGLVDTMVCVIGPDGLLIEFVERHKP